MAKSKTQKREEAEARNAHYQSLGFHAKCARNSQKVIAKLNKQKQEADRAQR